MDIIRDITKNTLFELKNKNIYMTPENYFIEFKKQAEKLNINLGELRLFDEIKNSLSRDEKLELNIDSFNKLATILAKRVSPIELRSLIETFDDMLSPSLNLENRENVKKFICEIIKNPKKLITKATISRIKEFTNQRIDSDRKVLKDKTDDLVRITSLMSQYLNKTLDDSDLTTNDIVKIKDNLVNLNILNSPHEELKSVQKKLIDTINKMEDSIKENKKILSNNIKQLKSLNTKVENLQKELVLAKQEQQFDFLTKLLNRRAYHEEAKKIENDFSILGTSFALIFIDIDHFKTINDLYGHTCGDAILKNFASILKDLTIKEAILARYGGEEFIILMKYKEEEDIKKYIKDIKTILSSYIFIYKDQKIQINFSAGVAFRNKYTNFEDTQNNADELLYKAKNRGRNRVFFDTGLEL